MQCVDKVVSKDENGEEVTTEILYANEILKETAVLEGKYADLLAEVTEKE